MKKSFLRYLSDLSENVNESASSTKTTAETTDNILALVNAKTDNLNNNKLKILNKTERKNRMKIKSIIAAAATIAILGAGAYALTNSWNPKMAEIFKADEQTQKQLTDDGIAKSVNLSSIDNGVKMEVLQSLADENSAYILFRFSSENENLLKTDGFKHNARLEIDGFGEAGEEAALFNVYSGIVEDSVETTISENGANVYSLYYYMQVFNNGNQDYNGRTVTASFENMGIYSGSEEDFKTIIEGAWEASWTLEYQNQSKRVELNKALKFGEYEVILDYAEISPLIMKVVVSGGDLDLISGGTAFFTAKPILKNGEVFEDISSQSSGWLGDLSENRGFTLGYFESAINVDEIAGLEVYFPDGGLEAAEVRF